MLSLNFTPFPQLQTERLLLRQLVKEDAPALVELRSDERVNEFIDRPKAMDIERALGFVERINDSITKNDTLYWAISLREDAQLIGTICCWRFDLENRIAEVGYELFPAQQGKGIANEALQAVIKFMFEGLHFEKLLAVLRIQNSASLKLLERNQFINTEKTIVGNGITQHVFALERKHS